MISLSNDRRKTLAALVLLMAGAYCLYANTFGHPWIYDDFPVIVNNPDIRSLGTFLENSYPGRPLREITYLLDHALFGLESAGWHIQNIFWHGLNAFLVFMLARRLQGSRAVAWIASLLFLAHPLQVEVVANISHRKDSLALAFSLLSLLAYTEAFRPGRKKAGWLVLAGILGAVAFLGKQNALVLPLIFAAYEMAFLPREERWLCRFKGLFPLVLAIGAVAGLVWFFLFGGIDLHREAMQPLLIKMNYLRQGGEGVYFALILKSWAFMFLKLPVPVNLAPEYTFTIPASWADPWVLGALLGILGYAALLVWTCRHRPALFFALVWLGAFWLPVSNLWPLSYFAADRYLYAPSVGVFLTVALLMHRFLGARPALQWGLCLAPVLILAVLTVQQSRVWRSPLALWSKAVAVSPESTWALNNLGVAYMLEGEPAEALPLFKRAANNFNDSITLYNVGWAYEKLGDQRSALRYYQMFLSMNDPKYRIETEALRRRLGWR